MSLDLKTSLVAVPVLMPVLIVKVVTDYWVHTDLNLSEYFLLNEHDLTLVTLNFKSRMVHTSLGPLLK